MTNLNEIELVELEYFGEEEKSRFKITDLETLNWTFRKASALQCKINEITELASREVDRIKKWEVAEKKKYQDNLSFFEYLVKEYHEQELRNDPKAKTLSTPYGKSSSTRKQRSTAVKDEKAVLEHLSISGLYDYQEVNVKLKWAELKKNLKLVDIDGETVVIDENGMVVNGIEVKPEEVTFKLKVGE